VLGNSCGMKPHVFLARCALAIYQPLVLVCWSAIVLAMSAPGHLMADQRAECRRVALDPAPSWSFSAAWSSDGRELTLVDVLGGDLLRYTEEKFHGIIARPGMGALEFDHPAQLTSISGGYLVTNPPGKVIWLDQGFRPIKSVDLLKAKKSKQLEGEITNFDFSDAIPAGPDLLSFAVVHRNGKPWQGYVRVSIKPFELTDFIEEIDSKAPEDKVFRLQGEAIAPAAGGYYVLRYSQPTFILELAPEKRRLKAFPPGFEALPKLPELGGFAAASALYKALEHSTAATGLYGRGGLLYLLTRRPAAQGTLWQLWQIDPRRDAVLRSLTLPTTANHVFLAPGPKDWAVIEKGPVVEAGQQAIRSMLLIPTPWIEGPSKVLADGNSVPCR
jgi:hypothetical protein